MDQNLPRIDGYSLIRQLGEGGMGTVYFGRRQSDQRPVAVKVIRADAIAGESSTDFIARFRREIKVCATFAHPYVTTTLDGGRTNDGLFYLVMEYIEGDPLDELIESKELTEEGCFSIAKQMGEALSYIHSHGICHRDIKPGNIIVISKERSVLVDFGLALSDEYTRITDTRDVVGTFRFMAPERIQGQEASFASDIYALGVTFYNCLANRFPYEHDSIMQMAAHLKPDAHRELTELNDEVSLSFSNFVKKCLSINPKDRFQSAKEYLEALDGLYEPVSEPEAQPDSEHPVVEVSIVPKVSNVYRQIFVAICLFLCLLIAFELALSRPRSTERVMKKVQPLETLKNTKGEKRLILLMTFIEEEALAWYKKGESIPNPLLVEVVKENKAARLLTMTTMEQIAGARDEDKTVLLPLLIELLNLMDKEENYLDEWQEIEREVRKVVSIIEPMLSKVKRDEEEKVLQCLFLARRFDYGKEARKKTIELTKKYGLSPRLQLMAAYSIARVRPGSVNEIPDSHRQLLVSLLERALPKLQDESERQECLYFLAKELCRVERTDDAVDYLVRYEPSRNAPNRMKRAYHYRKALVFIEMNRLDEAMTECQHALRVCESEAKRETIKSEVIRIKTLKLLRPKN